jgi:hypothetical protein
MIQDRSPGPENLEIRVVLEIQDPRGFQRLHDVGVGQDLQRFD